MKISFLIKQVLKILKVKLMDKTPLVSIVTPCYNAEDFIGMTIESVLAQTYQNWEMIIVDDGSDDKSTQIVATYAKQDSRIKPILNQKNIGVAKSRNNATDKATGKYIALLDSDDTWFPEKLKSQLELMKKENASMSYVAYYTVDDKDIITAYHPVKERVSYTDLLKKPSIIGTLTMIYDAQKLGKFYFEDIGHEDYIMKLSILKKIDFAVGINKPLAKYRIHNNSLSSNKLSAAKWVWDIYRNSEKLSFTKSLFYFLHYTYYSFTKYKKL